MYLIIEICTKLFIVVKFVSEQNKKKKISMLIFSWEATCKQVVVNKRKMLGFINIMIDAETLTFDSSKKVSCRAKLLN